MGSLLTGLLQRYARYASRKPAIPLIVIACTLAISLYLTRFMGLDASFEALLPEDTPSVQARQEARERSGASDLFLIVVQSPDPEANYRLAQALAAGIESWPESEWVMDHVDLDVFRERALLYMDLDDLTELVDLVELQVLRGQCEFQGNCNERDLRTNEEREADERRLRELGDAYGRRVEETAGDRSELASEHPELRDALMSPDGTRATVLAKLERGTNDIEFARQAMLRGEALIEELDPTSFHPEMRAEVGGAYRSSTEYDTVLNDATTASVVSLTLVVLVVVLFLRRFSAVVLVAGALIVGITWTMGLTALTYPMLNTITAVIFGILLGMGIDYSIHLCVASRAARSQTNDLAEALAIGVKETTPAMMTSAMTTAAALLTLAAAHNRGFREFGLIGAGGVILCFLSAELLIPPVWGLLERVKADTRTLAIPSDRLIAKRGPIIALALFLVLSTLLSWRAPALPFEYNLSNLSAPRVRRGISYGDTLRTGRGTTPAALLGDSEEQLRLAHRMLTTRRDEGDERLLDVITIETFVPPQQDEKLEEVERLRSLLRPRTLRRVAESYREELDELSELAQIEEPVTFEHLPGWAQRNLRERDGSVGHVGLLYMAGSHADARESMEFQRDYGRIDVGQGRPVRVAASPFIIADVVYTVIDDGEKMALLTVAAVLLLLIVDLRSVVGTLGCFAALVLGVVWAFGAAQWLGWKLGVFNMLVIPVAMGLGIDGSIHVYHRYKRQGNKFLDSPLGATGLAVLASGVTTLAGFSGLLAVQHRGLKTIGQLAVLTVGFTLIAVLGVLPGVLVALARRRQARRHPKEN